jgi:hypothetical protein
MPVACKLNTPVEPGPAGVKTAETWFGARGSIGALACNEGTSEEPLGTCERAPGRRSEMLCKLPLVTAGVFEPETGLTSP